MPPLCDARTDEKSGRYICRENEEAMRVASRPLFDVYDMTRWFKIVSTLLEILIMEIRGDSRAKKL